LRRLERQQQLRILAEAQLQISRSAPVSPVSHSRYGSSSTGCRRQHAVQGARAGAVSALSSYEYSYEAVTQCSDSISAGGLPMSPTRAATAAVSRLSFGTAMFDDLTDSGDSSSRAEMHSTQGHNDSMQQSAYMEYLRGYRPSASSRQNQTPAKSSGGRSSASDRSRAAYQAAFEELQRLREFEGAEALTSPRARAYELLANGQGVDGSAALRACSEPRRRSASALAYHTQLQTQRSGGSNVECSNGILKRGSRSTNCSPERYRGQDLLASVISHNGAAGAADGSSSAYQRSMPNINGHRQLTRARTADSRAFRGADSDGFIEPNSPLAPSGRGYAAAGAAAGRGSWDGSSGGAGQSGSLGLRGHRASSLGRRSYSPARRVHQYTIW
jgi:hypothetical protein